MLKKPGPRRWTGELRGRRSRGSPRRALVNCTFLLFPSVFPLKRAPSLELCAPRTQDFLGATAWVSFSSCTYVYISLRDERQINETLLLEAKISDFGVS